MTTLAEEFPYAATVDHEKIRQYCSKCFKMDDNLHRCLGCKFVSYCDKNCQKADWKDHKDECSILKRNSQDVFFQFILPSRIRLVFRVFFKIRRGDFGSSFNGRTVQNLMDHKKDIRESEQFSIVELLTAILERHLGNEKPTVDEVLSAYGKVEINCHSMVSLVFPYAGSFGNGLYLGISAQDHSCVPDAHVLFEGPKIILRSFDKEMKYSKDVTISYIETMELRADRMKKLWRQHFFHCHCVMCEDRQWDRLARGIICKYCEDGACPVYEGMSQEDLVCNSCEKPSKITVDMALNANRQAEQWENAGEEMMPSFESNSEKYERLSKILSTRNIFRSKLAERMMLQAMISNRTDLHIKYIMDALESQKFYQPTYLPQKATYLHALTRILSMQNPLNEKKRWEVIEEAYECALVAYGPNHVLFQDIAADRQKFRYSIGN